MQREGQQRKFISCSAAGTNRPQCPACTAGMARGAGYSQLWEGAQAPPAQLPGHPYLQSITLALFTALLQTIQFLMSKLHLCSCSPPRTSLPILVTSTRVWGLLPHRASEPTSWFIVWKGPPPHPLPGGSACLSKPFSPYLQFSGGLLGFSLGKKHGRLPLSQNPILSIYKNVEYILAF